MISVFLTLAFVGVIGYGCAQVQNTDPSGQTYGVLMGTVKDSSGGVLTGVTVTASSSSGATNGQGWFSITNITANTREVVTFSKTGYVTTQKTFSISSGQATFGELVLNAANSSHSFTSSVGTTVSDTASSGLTATVTLAAGSLVDSSGAAYSGAAKVILTPMDPTVSPESFPGNFEGVDSTGATVPFRSFGYFSLNLTDSSDNTLNLAAGNSLQISMQVPSTLTSEAATAGTVPMWYFDAATAKWTQSGTATYDATSKRFVGIISRGAAGAFATAPVVLPSVWNFDKPFSNTGTISGKVVDAFGNPVANALVVCDGSGFRATGYTGSDGKFSSITAPSGISLTYYAQKGGNRSTVLAISPDLTAGENRSLSDITISSASLVQVTLTWGVDPSDLDSHLTVPNSVEGGSRYHLYYSNRSSTPSTSWPYVKLDTDDTSSYGPEVVSVYKLYNGTYRYCVHHYSGSSDISNSGATINLIISGGSRSGIYNFTPPAGATAVNDVWNVFDLGVDSSGNVSSISTLGTISHNVTASSHEAYSPNNEATIGSLGVSSAGLIEKKK